MHLERLQRQQRVFVVWQPFCSDPSGAFRCHASPAFHAQLRAPRVSSRRQSCHFRAYGESSEEAEFKFAILHVGSDAIVGYLILFVLDATIELIQLAACQRQVCGLIEFRGISTRAGSRSRHLLPRTLTAYECQDGSNAPSVPRSAFR